MKLKNNKKNVVYKLLYGTCLKVYVGQIGRVSSDRNSSFNAEFESEGFKFILI